MPTEAVEPTPKWMDTPFHGHYRKHFLGGKVPRALTVLTFFGFMASFVAYADRRCLYIYQKHDPRKVSLPWQDAFNSKYSH